MKSLGFVYIYTKQTDWIVLLSDVLPWYCIGAWELLPGQLALLRSFVGIPEVLNTAHAVVVSTEDRITGFCLIQLLFSLLCAAVCLRVSVHSQPIGSQAPIQTTTLPPLQVHMPACELRHFTGCRPRSSVKEEPGNVRVSFSFSGWATFQRGEELEPKLAAACLTLV